MACGYCLGQPRFGIFPLLPKVLLDSTVIQDPLLNLWSVSNFLNIIETLTYPETPSIEDIVEGQKKGQENALELFTITHKRDTQILFLTLLLLICSSQFY